MASLVFKSFFIFFFIHYYLVSSNKILSNLEFMKSLIGIQKGNNAEGVHKLKKYLRYLGYLNYNCSNKQTCNNIFDDSLEFALQKYQKFYNLNSTGVLYNMTIARMQSGMPDFHNHNDTHMVSRYSFFPGKPRWRKRILTYAFNRNMKGEAIPLLESAIQEWAAVTTFKFFRVKYFRDANIRISFLRGRHGDGLPFGGPDPEGGIAHAFQPPDGQVHFDAAQLWAHEGGRNGFDIKTVGLHELGHVLGLGHSDVPQAVMYGTIAPGERKRLHEDDVKGIKTLYKIK